MTSPKYNLAEARRQATDIARRSNAACRCGMGASLQETFSKIYDEALTELLAEQQTSEAA